MGVSSAILSVYRNCSLGGVVTVMRRRIAMYAALGHASDFYFLHDYGGADSLLSAGARRVRLGRLSHENNVLTAATEDRHPLVNLYSNYALGGPLRGAGARVHVEVHGSHISAVQELGHAGGHYDRIIVPSEWSRSWLASEGFDPDTIAVVPNTVDAMTFHPGPSGAEVPSQAPPVVWIGRLEEHKNWRDALIVLALLRRRALPVRLVMILSLHNDRDRVHEFMRQLSLLGLLEATTLLYNLPQTAVADVLREAARDGGCLLMTSQLESFGLAASESLACGLPVVCPAVGALPERVRHGRDGFLFGFGERERPAALIESLIFDPAARASVRDRMQAPGAALDAAAEAALRRVTPSAEDDPSGGPSGPGSDGVSDATRPAAP